MSPDPASFNDLDLGATIRGFVAGQKLFGRYTLLRTLGRGGMSVVWLAQDERLGQEVALKFLPEMVRLDSAAIDDLKHETRRSLQLTHRNIVRIYDFEEDAQSAALAMEYVPGATLSAMRVARPAKIFEPADLMPWVRELCDALDYAHRKGRIVHRDLKPANLMVGAHGELKVADFGIARSINESVSRVSAQPAASGTLGYMSPQQALGQPATPRDDIYSLGATLYELLTGRPPFYSGNIQHQLDTVAPPTIAARRAELEIEGQPVPEAWETTIAACLAKDPSARPASVGEVVERLLAPPAKPAPLRVEKSAAASPRAIRVSTKTKVVALTGLVVLIAAGASLGYHFGVAVPRAREIERQRIAAIEAAQREAVEKARIEEGARQRAAAEALAREEAERAAEAQRIADEQAAEELRLAEAEREALASRTAPPAAVDPDAVEDELTEKAAVKVTPKRSTPGTSTVRSKASTFGKKVKHFFGF